MSLSVAGACSSFLLSEGKSVSVRGGWKEGEQEGGPLRA